MQNISENKISYDDFVSGTKGKMVNMTKALRNSIAYAGYLQKDIEKSVILFESEEGKILCGKPLEIFEKMYEEYQDSYRYVWVVRKKTDVSVLKEKNNVTTVIRNSKKYYDYLATCGYLVNDYSFGKSFVKRKDQRLLHTGIVVRKQRDISRDFDFTMRHMLQADFILSDSFEYTENILKKQCHLGELFQGKVLECVSTEEAIECLLKEEKPTEIETKSLQTGKKRLLFYCNFEFMESEWNDIVSIISFIDPHQYDVTIITERIEPGKRQLLYLLPDYARIIERIGRMVYNKEEYLDYLYLRSSFLYADHVIDAMNEIPGELFSREWRRLVGDVFFDTAILLSHYGAIDFLLFHLVPSSKRYLLQASLLRNEKIELSQDEAGKQMFRNKLCLSRAFDRVIHLTYGMMMDHQMYLENVEHQTFLPKLPVYDDLTTRGEKNHMTEYMGKHFFVIEHKKEVFEQKTVMLFPAVQEDEIAYMHIISDYSGNEIKKILLMLWDRIEKDENSRLYIFDSFNVLATLADAFIEKYSANNKVVILNKAVPNDQYIQQFKYIVAASSEIEMDLNRQWAKRSHIQLLDFAEKEVETGQSVKWNEIVAQSLL